MNRSLSLWDRFVLVVVLVASSVVAVGPSRGAVAADAGALVSGTVSTVNGPVDDEGVGTAGWVAFFADCRNVGTFDEQPVASTIIFEGEYEVELPPGQYRLRISPETATGAATTWFNGRRQTFSPSGEEQCEAADVLTVGAGATTVDLTAVVALPLISGAVSSRSGPITDGEYAFFSSCQDFYNGSVGVHGEVRDGTYGTRMLPAGQYRVLVTAYGGGAALESWHDAQVSCETAAVVTVGAEPSTIDLVAAVDEPVTGTVTSSKGLVSKGIVTFYGSCQEYNSDATLPPSGRLRSGSFSAEMPAGQYRVLIQPGVGIHGPVAGGTKVAVKSWHRAKPACESADLVTVGAGGGRVDVVATAAGRRRQTVTRPTTPAVAGTKVPLVGRTDQGQRVKWRTKTAQICTVSKRGVTMRTAGRCRLVAIAPGAKFWKPFRGRYTIRVRDR